nr:hypothetical protein [Tanacetum cinerariifolium]
MNDSLIELCETFQAWLQQQEQVVNLDSYTLEPSQCRKIPIYYDDDDEEESSATLRDIIISELPPSLKDNPTQSSKSSSTSLNSFLKETNTFHNSLPEFKNFYCDLGEISSGSTTTHSDISLPYYEAFYFDDDHVKEISSGSTTTHSDISLSEYDSFIFDLTHEEFVDELARIISPPKIRENLPYATSVNLPIEDDHSPLLAYVVWIFVVYLTNEDTIFDPGITINHFYSLKPGSSHRHRAFKKFNTHRSHLNEWPVIINGKNTPLLDVLLFHFYPL